MEEKTNEIIIESSDDDLTFLSVDSEVSVQKVEQDGFIPMTINGEEVICRKGYIAGLPVDVRETVNETSPILKTFFSGTYVAIVSEIDDKYYEIIGPDNCHGFCDKELVETR
jgi:hypothetical protein